MTKYQQGYTTIQRKNKNIKRIRIIILTLGACTALMGLSMIYYRISTIQ